MNEETRLIAQFKELREQWKQANKNLRQARHDYAMACTKIKLVQERLARVRWGNMPMEARVRRLPTNNRNKPLRDGRDRELYNAALKLKEQTKLALYDNHNYCVCDILADKVNLSRFTVWRAIKRGRDLPDSVITI